MQDTIQNSINEKKLTDESKYKEFNKLVYIKIIQYSKKLFSQHQIKTSADIQLPTGHYSHIIGQNNAVQAMRLALKYNRHVLLIGEPGTGKSLLAKAASSEVPSNEFILVSTNNLVEAHKPIVHYIKLNKFNWYKYAQVNKFKPIKPYTVLKWYLIFTVLYNIFAMYSNIKAYTNSFTSQTFVSEEQRLKLFTNIFTIHYIVSPWAIVALFTPYFNILDAINGMFRSIIQYNPLAQGKVIYDTKLQNTPNFVDATGADSHFIMGTVSHDPLAGLSIKDPLQDVTYKLLKPGAIHKAHGGVLYIDEVGRLDENLQYMLLTVLQDKQAYIQAGAHSGTMSSVQTSNKIPADFRLIMAGNLETVSKIHIALRSRIKGYGYEIVMNNSMPITEQNTLSLLHFIKREIISGNYLDCTRGALVKLLYQSVLQSRVQGQYSLQLRNFIGYIRTASDYAKLQNKPLFDEFDLNNVINVLPPLQTQIAKTLIKDYKTDYKIIIPSRLHTTGEQKAQWQMLPLVIGVEFYESEKGYEKAINLVNLEIRSNNPERLNRYYACSMYISTILERYIKTNKKLTIRFLNNYINQFDIASEHLALGILAQYYKRSYDTVYIGLINEFGKVFASRYDIELIKTALQKNYTVVTTIENRPYFKTNLKVRYIETVDEILDTQRSRDTWL